MLPIILTQDTLYSAPGGIAPHMRSRRAYAVADGTPRRRQGCRLARNYILSCLMDIDGHGRSPGGHKTNRISIAVHIESGARESAYSCD